MRTLSDKIEKAEKLVNGNGIKYLLSEAYKILKNPCIMFDTDFCLIANTPDVESDDRMWLEITSKGTICHEVQEFFKEEGFIDAIANAKSIVFLISDKLRYDRILGKLFSKNNTHVANLVMIACHRPMETDDPVVFEAICKVISNEICTSKFYQDYEKLYQESLIRRLIDGIISDRELYAAHIAILYNGLKTNLFVAVLDFSQCDPEHNKLTYYRDLLRKTKPDFKYAIYSNYIVIIMSSDNPDFDLKKDLNKLNGLFKQKNIYAGISGSFENIYLLPKFYADAVDTLDRGLKSRVKQHIFLYDDTKKPTDRIVRR